MKDKTPLVDVLYQNDEITSFHSKNNLYREPIVLRALQPYDAKF